MVTALVLSGGTGTRIGTEIPKQYIKVNARPIISYCLRTLFFHEGIDGVQIVADEMWREPILECMSKVCADEKEEQGIMVVNGICGTACKEWQGKFRGFSKPGETRQLSILNGLEDIRKYAGDSDYVLIHDAARPLLSAALISDCLNAVASGHDGALPVLPMKDTVYFSEDGRGITSLLERSSIFAGQAPEIFVLGKYYKANQRLLPKGILRINGSTEPAVMAGMDIVVIPGDEGNYKITTIMDLERFREKIAESLT